MKKLDSRPTGFQYLKTVHNSMLIIPIVHGSYQPRSAYVIDINMILHLYFTMFIGLNDTALRQHGGDGHSSASTTLC